MSAPRLSRRALFAGAAAAVVAGPALASPAIDVATAAADVQRDGMLIAIGGRTVFIPGAIIDLIKRDKTWIVADPQGLFLGIGRQAFFLSAQANAWSAGTPDRGPR